MLRKNAQDVSDLFAVACAGPAPADHDPLADVGGREPDFEPVAHAAHLFALSLRSMRGSAMTYVMGGSTSAATRPHLHAAGVSGDRLAC